MIELTACGTWRCLGCGAEWIGDNEHPKKRGAPDRSLTDRAGGSTLRSTTYSE